MHAECIACHNVALILLSWLIVPRIHHTVMMLMSSHLIYALANSDGLAIPSAYQSECLLSICAVIRLD